MTTGRATLLMVVATLLWGATFVVAKDILRSVPPATLMVLRFGFGSLLWAAVLGARWMAVGPPRHGVRAALVGGLVSAPFGAAGYLFQTIGQTATSAGSSAFLTSTGALFAALFAWPLLGLRPPVKLMAGIALAMAGSALLGLSQGLTLGIGEAWTLAGALVFALQIVAVARWAKDADAPILTAVQTVIAVLIALPFSSDPIGAFAGMEPATLWGLGYLVVAGSVIAPLLQVVAQKTLTPGHIGLLFALEPVFALVFALALGGERFVPRWWAGAGLILTGVLFAEWRALRPATRPRASG